MIKERQRVSPRLSTDAFKVFIHHYFSFSWLREFLLENRIFEIVRYADVDEETYDEEETEMLQSVQNDWRQTIDDLMFLIRVCHDRTPTAQILFMIMKIIHESSQHYTNHGRSTEFLNSIYFAIAIQEKISTPNKALAQSWKQILRIPLKEQSNNTCYLEARLKEATVNGYTAEKDLRRALGTISGKSILTRWISSEHELQEQIERDRTTQHFGKYFEVLSNEARVQGDQELSQYWGKVSCNEMEHKRGDLDLLRAWSLRRAKSPIIGPIWNEVLQLVKRNSSPEACQLAKLAFETERSLQALRKWEVKAKNFRFNDDCEVNVTFFEDFFAGVPAMIRARVWKKINEAILILPFCANGTVVLSDFKGHMKIVLQILTVRSLAADS
jgi:hypothetical protein